MRIPVYTAVHWRYIVTCVSVRVCVFVSGCVRVLRAGAARAREWLTGGGEGATGEE